MNSLPEFQADLARRLLVWSGISIVAGLFLAVLPDRFSRGLGYQFAGWGLVDGLIGLIGLRGARRQVIRQSGEEYPSAQIAETERDVRNFQHLLLVNTGLDVVYMSGGLQTMRSRGQRDPYWRGTGMGIFFQGAFLFLFDLLHAVRLTK